MLKPVVYYREIHTPIVEGCGCIVTPINHPSDLVSNTRPALTSKVLVAVREDGGFETMNTIYCPAPEDNAQEE
jgi:hypothetical protein